MKKENIIYDETTEEYKAIKWLENKTTNYSDDGLTLHYNLILYNLTINLQRQLKKKEDIIDKAVEYVEEHRIKNPYHYEFNCFMGNARASDLLDILKEVK